MRTFAFPLAEDLISVQGCYNTVSTAFLLFRLNRNIEGSRTDDFSDVERTVSMLNKHGASEATQEKRLTGRHLKDPTNSLPGSNGSRGSFLRGQR